MSTLSSLLPSCMYTSVHLEEIGADAWSAEDGTWEASVPSTQSEEWTPSAETSPEDWTRVSVDDAEVESTPQRRRRRKSVAAYKHVPHRDKPPVIVERRNARERRRVQAVNVAFVKLRKVVPIENNRGKRVSKVKTLLKAIEYIDAMQRLLSGCGDVGCAEPNKENAACGQGNHQWAVNTVDGSSLAELLDFADEEF